MVHWLAEQQAPIAWQGKVANLEDLLVLQERRNQGVGTALLLEAENLVRERGQSHVSLGVGVDNPNARRLYERLGYRDAGLAPVHDGGVYRDRQGDNHSWQEAWVFMVKELGIKDPGDFNCPEGRLRGADSSHRSE
jgi:ribosomal protein S18 acetylase RimI-like enzyme